MCNYRCVCLLSKEILLGTFTGVKVFRSILSRNILPRPFGPRNDKHRESVILSVNFLFLCVFLKQLAVIYLFLICYETFFKKELSVFCFSP